MIERSIIGCNEFVPRNNLYPIIHLSINIHKILFKNFICTVSVCKYSELLFVSSLLRSCCLFTQSLIQSEDSGVNFTKLCIARFPLFSTMDTKKIRMGKVTHYLSCNVAVNISSNVGYKNYLKYHHHRCLVNEGFLN